MNEHIPITPAVSARTSTTRVVSRRRVGAGGVVAVVAAAAVVAAVVASRDEVEEPLPAPRPAAALPSPSATRPSSRDVGGGGLPPVTPTPTEADQRPAPPDAVEVWNDADGSSSRTAPLLLGAGVVVVVGLRVRRGRRARPSVEGPQEPPPPAPQLDVYRRLPERADEPAASRLDSALVHLAGHVRLRSGQGCPQPRAARVSDGRIDVMLSLPDPSPPAPWRPEASGLSWVLDADVALPTVEDAFPLPALVTVGTGESHTLVDLEAYGVVALVGDGDACRAMARAMVAQVSARADGLVAVQVVGDALADAATGLDGVDHHESWSAVDTGTIGTSARLLDTGGWPHTWAARVSGRIYDNWEPTVWLTRASRERRYLDALDAIATRPGAGSVLVVVADDPGCGLRIHLDGHGRFEIADLNIRGTAHTLPPTPLAV